MNIYGLPLLVVRASEPLLHLNLLRQDAPQGMGARKYLW
jgi:hypothetical protein